MWKQIIIDLAIFTLVFGTVYGKNSSNPRVTIETSKGKIILELYADKAPMTVKNFLTYVEDGFYNGTIFHRVIPNFMIQGGGLTVDFKEKTGGESIQNEANNGIKNKRCTIAMARASDPHSASNQFFINSVNNDFLDFTAETEEGWGYCVFGKVIEGLGVVDAISSVKTMTRGNMRDVPRQTIEIISVKIGS
jgi:cyclophilin family peptidyl-prolyl cis-trans isomerase